MTNPRSDGLVPAGVATVATPPPRRGRLRLAWTVLSDHGRVVHADLPINARISRADIIAMGPQVLASLHAWAERHGVRLCPYADGLLVEDIRPARTWAATVLRCIPGLSSAA